MRAKVVLAEGESYVVATEEQWRYVIETFRILAKDWPQDSEEYKGWMEYANEFSEQVYDNLYKGELDDDWS